VQKICNVILGLLDQSLIPKASDEESKVIYRKMKTKYLDYMELAEWFPRKHETEEAGSPAGFWTQHG